MKLKTVTAALSKEEVHLADENGNFTRTWARIELGAELEPGEDEAAAIQELRRTLQAQVDDWLLDQGGYIPPAEAPAEKYPELEEVDAATSDDIPD